MLPGDIVQLKDGRVVHVTDVADAPETLFIFTDWRSPDGPPFSVIDRSEVDNVWISM
jgi:hypothetical protein